MTLPYDYYVSVNNKFHQRHCCVVSCEDKINYLKGEDFKISTGFCFWDFSLMLDLWYKRRLHMGPYPVLDDPIAVINSRYYDNVCFFQVVVVLLLGMR